MEAAAAKRPGAGGRRPKAGRAIAAGAAAFVLFSLVIVLACDTKPGAGPASGKAGTGTGEASLEAGAPSGTRERAEASKPPPAPRKPGPREWLAKRTPGDPLLCYLFDARRDAMLPLGGTLLGGAKTPDGAGKDAREPPEAPDQGPGREADEAGRERARLCALEREGPVVLTHAGVRVDDGGKLYSRHAGEALAALIRERGAFSVEALVTPADTGHGGPARIVSLSRDGSVRNFTLGQEGARWSVRIRTPERGPNGSQPALSFDGLSTKLAHVVVSYDGREMRFYLDGELRATREDVRGDLKGWDTSFPLVLGNEFADARDWAGVIRFVAFYDRALSAGEVGSGARDLPPGTPSDGGRPGFPGGAPEEGDEVF